MLKLSSIIIAKNEEMNIGRCIDSQLGVIDEIIVVVDESTTDQTAGIVKSYSSVKFITSPWLGYSETKNLALGHTSNNWVLWIDADEALTKELAAELRSFKQQEPVYRVYSVPRKAYFLGRWIKHSGWYPGRVERLFDKTKVRFSESGVHEHLVYEGAAGRLDNDIEHYTDPSIFHYYEKYNRYTSLAAEELNKKGKRFKLSDLILRPCFLFIKMYLLRLGFMDGLQGFMLAYFSAGYVFTKYAKLWEIERDQHERRK